MSGCSDVCFESHWDYENEFHSAKQPVARKAHMCGECGRAITAGEMYENVHAKSDGRFWCTKTCAECAEIRTALCCGAWVYGIVWDQIEDQAFPKMAEVGPYECLAELPSKAARDKLQTRFDEWHEVGE